MYPSIRCIRCDALLLSNRGVGGDRRDPHLPGAIEAVAQQVASGAARLLCLCAVATYIGRCIHSCWQARLGIGFACSVLFRLRAEVHVVGVDGSAGGGRAPTRMAHPTTIAIPRSATCSSASAVATRDQISATTQLSREAGRRAPSSAQTQPSTLKEMADPSGNYSISVSPPLLVGDGVGGAGFNLVDT